MGINTNISTRIVYFNFAYKTSLFSLYLNILKKLYFDHSTNKECVKISFPSPALIFLRFSAALAEAAHADRLIEEETGGEEALADKLPLLGVPLSVKESFFLQGKPLVNTVSL